MRLLICITLLLALLPVNSFAKDTEKINVGYFEAGHYPVHSLLRDEYFKQLQQLLPENIEIVQIPEGYRSADWDRATSITMAKQLKNIKHLDIVIAFGPWVVNDLLEAGFTKPIIGLHQFNPKAEGLLDENNRPVADNLTVHFRPGKTLDDIHILTKLFKVKKLGLLYFPTEQNKFSMSEHIKSLGQRFGFEVVTAEKYDNKGTYAFFKSYNAIRGKIDALYLPPLWGLETKSIGDFFEMLNREKVPTFTDEGGIIVEKGATATNNYFGVVSEARFNAVKTVDIINGKTPADLPVIFRSGFNLAVNQKSVSKCKVRINSEVFNNYTVIGSKPTEDIPLYQLSELVNRAIYQNPGFLAASDAVAAAQSDVDISKSGYFPQLYGQLSVDNIDENLRHNSLNRLDKNIYQSSLNLEQKLFSLESLKSINSAKKKTALIESDQKAAQLDLELAVSLAYLDYLKFSEQLKALKNIRTMLNYNLETAHAIQIISGKDSLAILRMESKRYNLTLKNIELLQLRKSSRIILNSLLNLPAEEKYILQDDLFTEDRFIQYESAFLDKIKSYDVQRAIAQKIETEAFANNPALARSDFSIEWQKALLDENKSSFYPTVGLHASLYYNDYLKESALFEEKKTGWTVGGKISLPLYLGGKRLKEKGKLKANLSQAEYEKDAAALEIMRTSRTEFQRLLSHAQQMTPAYLAKERGYRSINIAIEKFGSENISAVDFLDILSTTLDSDLRSIDTRFEYYASMARLIHTIGLPVGDDYTNFVERFHTVLNY